MNTQIRFAVVFSIATILAPHMGSAQAPSSGGNQSAAAKLSSADLDNLVAPIALYPDALLAHVLPASTAPLDVVQAARYLSQHGGKVDKTPDNNWNTSVKVLMQFPDVLDKLNANLDWTSALGNAVTSQMDDVMKSIQRVRAQAQAAGNLNSNDKQNVVVQGGAIEVLPADPTVIYVPTYNPSTVIVQQDTSSTAAYSTVAFATGVVIGAALADDHCDWYGGAIYHGAYYRGRYAYATPYHNFDDYWRDRVHRPLNPRGVADPRGLYDPRGIADPRGRYDPRGPYDPRGRYDPRSARPTPYTSPGYGRAGAGGQAGFGGGSAAGRGGFGEFGGGSESGRGYGRRGSGEFGSGGRGQSAFGGRQGGYSQTRSSSERGRQSLSQGRSSSGGRSFGSGSGRRGGSSIFSERGSSGGRRSGGFGGGGRRGGRR